MAKKKIIDDMERATSAIAIGADFFLKKKKTKFSKRNVERKVPRNLV